ncbi:MAG TPA: DUF3800 domain-containing protein [Longimicrobiaceae bacterium]|nr:DUF3800 domain-containing protein [Longimicrobiaceae bacterium]
MARKYIFADESGNFDFSRKPGASRYFILTTIACHSCAPGDALLNLRRELVWDGHGLASEFHATDDTQAVRDRVFETIAGAAFQVDVTILEKSKALPRIRATDELFYRYAWYLHLKHVAPRFARPCDELLVVGASLGTRKKRNAMHTAVHEVVQQVTPTATFRVAAWAAHSDPCLQVADYCCWALSRKWERGDTRSYDLISRKIATEFEVFARGTEHHY